MTLSLVRTATTLGMTAGSVHLAVVAIAPAVGSLPPGTENLAVIIGWTIGLVGVALFAGFAVSLGKSGLGALAHGQFTGGMGSAICLVCAVMLSASGAIFAALGYSVPGA